MSNKATYASQLQPIWMAHCCWDGRSD